MSTNNHHDPKPTNIAGFPPAPPEAHQKAGSEEHACEGANERPMRAYEARQEAKRYHLQERAAAAHAQSNAAYGQARLMAAAIPFGQPILVGHHSERRDRSYRARIHDTFGK